MNTMYRIVDPQHVYHIAAVELATDGLGEAVVKAAEAMMGCPITDVDERVAQDFLEALEVNVWTDNDTILGWAGVDHKTEAVTHMCNLHDELLNVARREASCDICGGDHH
jgi:hypothetical protein